jgi:16S rRNA processing protein RimM
MSTNLVPPEGWMEIGSIVGAQGLKGEVKVYPHSDFPERFERSGERWLWNSHQTEPRSIQLERGYHQGSKNLYILKLAGINDRDRAEELRGMLLVVPMTDRPKLAPGEYHSQDLIGLSVFDQQTGVAIGTVKDIFTTGHDILVVTPIEPTAKGRDVLIPFVLAIVPVVDLDHRRIEVLPPPGLLDL